MARARRTPFVRLNIRASYVFAACCFATGGYAIYKDKWYYAVILWVLALVVLAYARSWGHVEIETPLFKYKGNLAEEEVPRHFEGEEESEEDEKKL